MNPAVEMKNRIEERLALGLPGQWYAAAKSVQVKERPHATKVLGRDLVLWRDQNGRVQCLEDHCPHRGARLSRGEVHEGNISCRYHGVTLDGTGTILRVPAMPECPLEGRRAVASFATHEVNDAVFIYVPSAERPAPPPFVPPVEFTDPEWDSFLCMARWDCNYRYALDNLADPMHGCYLHANSFTLAYGAKQDLMKLTKNDDGFTVARVQQQGENFDWTQMVVTDSQIYCRLDIPYPPAAGPGGPFRIIGYVTPIDERACYVFFWRMRKVTGLAREAWRLLYRAILEEHHWDVLEQDREMLVDMPDDARMREMLYQHDVGVSRLRQMLKQSARSQIAAEEAASARTAS